MEFSEWEVCKFVGLSWKGDRLLAKFVGWECELVEKEEALMGVGAIVDGWKFSLYLVVLRLG